MKIRVSDVIQSVTGELESEQPNPTLQSELKPTPSAASTDQQGVSGNKSKPPDTTDTPEERVKLESLLAKYPEASPFVSDALGQGAWVGNCIGALEQWDLGDPEHAKQIMGDWVARWKGYPENYEASLEEVREASIRRR